MKQMKFFVSLAVIAFISVVTYYLSKKNKKRAVILTSTVAVLLLGFLAFAMYRDTTLKDVQCSTTHTTTNTPPASLKTAMDYFLLGDYDYDIGNCTKAIDDYSTSILLNPMYPQAYNNRAYTYMRLRDYKNALLDLNVALLLNPNYIQALMNRGDIHNYYYAIDRKSAIADYEKVITLGGTHGTSVCGHLFLAKHNGWNLGTVLALPTAYIKCM
jgi:tetratricopeptide (TPR) repeat protein